MQKTEIMDTEIFEIHRKRHGLTKTYVTQKIGMSRAMASRLFVCGVFPKTEGKKEEVIAILCTMLEVSRDELLIKI